MKLTTGMLILMPLLLTLMGIRIYLGYLGYDWLFTVSIPFSTVFSAAVIYSTLTFILLIFIFFLPSILITCLTPLAVPFLRYEEGSHRCLLVMLSFSLLCFLLIFFLTALVSAWVNNYHSVLYTFSVIIYLSVVNFSNYFLFRKFFLFYSPYRIIERSQVKIRVLTCVILPLAVMLAISYYAVVIGFFISQVDTQQTENKFGIMFRVTLMAMITGFMTLIPGIVHHFFREKVSEGLRLCSTALSVFVCLGGMVLSVPSFLPVVISKVLSSSGIADWQVRRYHIENFPAAKEFSRDSSWDVHANSNNGGAEVSGVLVYSLNNIQLLCPPSLKRYYLRAMHVKPGDVKHSRSAKAELSDRASSCRALTHDHIVRAVKDTQEIPVGLTGAEYERLEYILK